MYDLGLLAAIVLGFMLLMIAGFHIHTILLTIGILGLIYVDGFDIISGFLSQDPFTQISSYTLTTIPLFIIMAQFILKAGVVEDAFAMVYNISRGKPAVLGSLTILIGGLLGAVSGSGAATSASLGQVAVPELTKYGYKPALAGAISAASGSLSGIIPPSIILILFGVITETPISKLFIGAIIPGILMMLTLIVCLLFMFKDQRKKEDRISTGTREIGWRRSLIIVMVGLFIFTVVFGGIYSGFVTPTEAGAVGALAGLLTALLLGKLDLNFIRSSVSETAKITGMIIMILIGANIFSRFVSLSLLPRKITLLLEPLLEHPVLILCILTVLFFLLFMFIEGAAVILMTLPVVLPIIQAAGIDVLWFGVFIAVVSTLGLITPPVGLSVYAVSSTSGISSEAIFKYGIMIAVALTVVVCGLMIVFPEVVTWLPSTIR
ncbi:TRAP transporter large permease [Planococcus halocryophilus]|uniref:TRAP transporter large permease n=1 Tax=Planococcus halocryophilus TaxID=1215089 RepID=UPI001F0EB077|nr:TRAP transporter large permease subunit [Planococcus halocryophilus]MCH4827554.1 TRAP transporter large permease subunit [Planococcus halocryophilus]